MTEAPSKTLQRIVLWKITHLIPPPRQLPLVNEDFYNTEECIPLPFVFVGDDAFQLTESCMKTYGRKNMADDQRIFDYRLSRRRRVTENAFGI